MSVTELKCPVCKSVLVRITQYGYTLGYVAIGKDPKDPKLMCMKCRTLIKLKNYPQILEQLRKYISGI